MMAGFRKSQPWFLARSKLQLAYAISEYEKRLLPFLKQWRRQAKSRFGDKSSCCDNFLNEIIPYYIEVLVQDGIYFTRDFPQHPMSHYLNVSTVH